MGVAFFLVCLYGFLGPGGSFFCVGSGQSSGG